MPPIQPAYLAISRSGAEGAAVRPCVSEIPGLCVSEIPASLSGAEIPAGDERVSEIGERVSEIGV